MAEKEVVVKFKKDGTFTAEAVDFHGVGCKAILQAISQGNTVTKEVLKDEIYESGPSNNRLDAWA